MKSIKMKEMKIIGLSDKVSFPELELQDISAKIDTGAYTSSIHCHQIEVFTEDGQEKVAFSLLDKEHEAYNNKRYIMNLHKIRRVKSSNGMTENRVSIKTKVVLFKKTYSIELTLTDRKDMKFPVLLGRKILKGRFLVDVSKKNLSDLSKQGLK
ncbi:MAG: peptidase [Denitrovibrio sp.]|nr:MAG: peptidase [Denitrovibrio sp.]